ncbi:hypothetical protein ACHAXR_013564 [Thalassiosira sp. AJA248-18]
MSKMVGSRKSSAKRVQFSECSQLLIITEGDTDAKQEWYTKEDIIQFKKNVRVASTALRKTRTAKTMKYIARSAAAGSPQVDVHFHGVEHIRGIEHLLSPEVCKLLWVQRQNTIHRVLEEDQAQKRAGMGTDPSRTAQVSEANSSFSKEWSSRVSLFHHA